MKITKPPLRRRITLVVAGSVLFLAFIWYSIHHITRNSSGSHPAKVTTPLKKEAPKPVEVSYGLPVRLKIPKINVDAVIEQMGLTPEGDMQSPKGPRDAGWYKFGVRPGNKGSAVIAGHYGSWINGESSVFDRLRSLNQGDSIHVHDEKGAVAIFVVREFRTYKPNEITPEVFIANDEKAHLNLITCQGTWDTKRQTYSDRLVLFADKKNT